MADRTFRLRTLTGATLSVSCPPWCSEPHEGSIAENIWHEAEAVAFVGPGDYFGHFDDGEPYEVMWACISAEPDDRTGEYGRPYVYFDTQGQATGARLDVPALDAVLGDLRTYVDRLQQMRDRLAKIIQDGGEQ